MDPKTLEKPPVRESRFTDSFILANRLNSQDFKNWLLSPGMLFDADVEWWGNRALRKNLMRGLIFAFSAIVTAKSAVLTENQNYGDV